MAEFKKAIEYLECATPKELESICNDPQYRFGCDFVKGRYEQVFKEFVDLGEFIDFVDIIKPDFIYTLEFMSLTRDFLIVAPNSSFIYKTPNHETLKYAIESIDENTKTTKSMRMWDGKFVLHRDYDLPAVVEYKDGILDSKQWYKNGYYFRKNDKPTVEFYSSNGNVQEQQWYNSRGELDRNNGPAKIILLLEDGSSLEEVWYKNGKIHRKNGPALIGIRNDHVVYERYMIESVLHRKGGLAAEINYWIDNHRKEYELFYINGKPYRRIDYHHNGLIFNEVWYDSKERYHKRDGPAFVEYDEDGNIVAEEFYIHGNLISKNSTVTLHENMGDINNEFPKIKANEA